MKYFARVGSTEYEVVIDKDQVWINGEPVAVDVLFL